MDDTRISTQREGSGGSRVAPEHRSLELRAVIVLCAAPLLSLAVLLVARLLPQIIGRPLYDVAGIGLGVSLLALITVAAVVALSACVEFVQNAVARQRKG